MASKNLNDPLGFSKSAEELEKLNKALSSSFNSSLGMLDLSKLKTELNSAGVSAQTLGKAFKDGGAQGQIAFNNLLGQIGKIDTGLKRSSNTVDKMFNTIANTARWGIVSSGFSAMLNSLHESVNYVKELDDAMTQIMLVTDYSRQQMNDYAKSANEAAKALGNTTVGVMKGTQVFAQQGYDLQQSGQLAELSIKLANASEQDSATTSDQITALMNAYGLNENMGALSSALDSWAKVANVSAADVEELAKASQKAASTAATVDVSLEQLNAQIATIESVTKEAPEQIGNGLKTLYARFSDLQMGGSLEDGVTLGKVTSVLNGIGVEVLDAQGKMRSVGDMMEDMMEVWSDLDSTQKASVAQTVAGKYQLGRFEALMNSPEMYDEYAKASMNAEGTLDQMNEEYLDSLPGKSAKLQATLEGLFNSVFNPENFYPAIDALTNFIEVINKLIDSVGGGRTVLTGLIALFGQLFSNNIAQTISDFSANRKMNEIRRKNAENTPAILDQLGYNDKENLSADQNKLVDYVKYIQQNQGSMSEKQATDANKILEDGINSLNKYEDTIKRISSSAKELDMLLGALGDPTRTEKDANGKINVLPALEALQGYDDKSLSRAKETLRQRFGGDLDSLEFNINKINESGAMWAKSSAEEEKAMQQYDELSAAIDKTSDSLQKLKFYMSPDVYNELSNAIKEAREQYLELGGQTDEAVDKGKKAIQIAGELKDVWGQARQDIESGKGIDKAVSRAVKAGTEAHGAEASKDNALRMTEGVIETTDSQKQIKDIIDISMAVGDLTFAWQSFQSLGSLWNKDDVSDGEKLLQTIMNLSMTIPSLMQGFKAFGLGGNPFEAFKELSAANDEVKSSSLELANVTGTLQEAARATKTLENANINLAQRTQRVTELEKTQGVTTKQVAGAKSWQTRASKEAQAAQQAETAATHQLTAAETAETTATEAQTAATTRLAAAKKALMASIAPLLITAALAVAAAAWGNYQEKVRQAMETEKQAMDASSEKAKELVSSVGEWEKLYEQWQKTHVASQELVDSSNTLADDLDILGGKAFVAAGNFDTLAESIKKADSEAAEKAISDANALIDGEYGKSVTEDHFWNGSALGDYRDALSEASLKSFSYGKGGSYNDYISQFLEPWKDGESVAETIHHINAALENLNNERERLNNLKEEERPDNWQEQLDAVNNYIQAIQAVKNLEDVSGVEQAFGVKAENSFQIEAFQQKLKDAGNDAQALMNVFRTDNLTKDYFITLTTEADRLSYALKNVTEESQKIALSQALFKEQGMTGIGEEQKEDFLAQYFPGKNPLFNMENSESWTQDLIDQLGEEINNASISEEAKMAIRNNIDWSKPITEIIQTTLDKLEQQIENESTMNPLQNMKPIDEDVKEEDFQTTGDMFMDNKANLGVEGTPFEDYSEELANNAEGLSEVVEAILRYNDAIESIGKSYSDWKENLSKPIFDQDHIETVRELTDTYGDFLNLAEGTEVSEEFVENAENLEKMKEAADGVEGAYDDLAEAAAEDIMIHMNVDDIDNAKQTLDNLFNELQSENFQSLKIGDMIDFSDDQFDGLRTIIDNLLKYTGWSAEEMASYLNNIGIQIDPNQFEPVANGLDSLQYSASQVADNVANSAVAAGDAMENNLSGEVSAEMAVNHATRSDTKQFTELIPRVIPGPIVTQRMPAGVSEDGQGKESIFSFQLMGAGYEARPVPIQDPQDSTAATMKMQYKRGGKGGGNLFKLKDNATGMKNSNGIGGGGGPKTSFSSPPSYPGTTKGGGGGSCFVAGTKVSMQGYFKNIEEVQKGDIVLSYNEQIKRNEYSEVLQTMIHDTTENIYTLYIQDEKIKVTGIHKFFIIKENKVEWIAAEHLQVGDCVLYANGTKHKISKIEITLETQTVYNFEVSNNHNYYVGYNQILVHNKGGGRSKKPGGGSGGKSSKPKTKDPLEEKADLYEKVNTKLDDVESVLKKIQKESDRLIGTEGRANMNKQLTLLQREIDLQREKLRIQVKEREDLQKDLKKKYNVSFDSNGFIDNYSTVFKTLKSEYNQKIKEYNNASAEDQEKMEKGLEKAKKKFEDFKKDYQRYDQLQGKEIQETKNAIEELTDAMEDLRIKAYQSAMEAQERLKELGDDMAHFNAVVSNNKLDSPLANLIENTEKLNNLFSNGKKPAIDYYNTLIAEQDKLLAKTKDKSQRRAIKMQKKFYQDQVKNIQNSDDLYAGGAIQAATDRVNRALEFLENPNSADNPFKGNTAALQEELENAREYLADLIEEAKKALEDQEKYVIERIQELEENQQYFIDQLQTVNDHMEKTMDIYNLAFGEENYEEMINVYTRMAETTQASFNQAKANYEYWKDIWDNMSEKERLEDVGKQVKKEVDEWKGQMLDSEKEIVEYWGEVFTATTQKALKDATKTTFGRSNLDDIEANWQRDNDFSSRYYDDFQKQQRVEALRLKYMDLLDNAQNASLDTQRKIRDSMSEQVKYLENQTYLSEYNVKYANAQLEILQKQIALEDARNNKNQMRLRRDSQGNYRYVYSANKDDTRQKEQDLLQSQMDVYDMSKQNKSDTTKAAFDLWRSTMEQLQALEERARQGDEDAIRAREELLKDYEEAMKAYGLEYKASTDGMIKAVQWMAESGIESVQDVAAKALEALKSNNHEALQEMGIEGDAFLDNILENADTATSAINKAVQDMDEAITQYHNHLVATGGVFDNIQEGYSGISDAIGEASDATDKLVDATREFKEVIRPDDGDLKNYINQIETLRSNVTSLTNEKSAAVVAVRKAQDSEREAKTTATQYKLAFDTKHGDKSIERGSIFTLKKDTWVYYGRGGGQKDNKKKNGFKLPYDMQVKVYETDAAAWGQDDEDVLAKYPISFFATGDSLKKFGPRVHDDDSEEGKDPKHKKHEAWHLDDTQFREAITMDTGGYTGEWTNGSDKNNGRFAMLHQKEMVLNENDTANILEAVQMVRTMTDALKLLGNMGAYKGTGFNKLGGDTIKQRVEITAEFPNVSNSNEIETALLSLADSAYQYSYRER